VVIHQPAENLFQEFDEIICLRRGAMAFQGPYQDVKDYVEDKVKTILCRPLSERTFPDWLLDLAANFTELTYIDKREDTDEACVADVKPPSRSQVSFQAFLGNVITLLAFHGYNPFEAGLVISGCSAYAVLVFRPICDEDGWMPRHDIFRVTITGFVVGLQASRVLPLLYLELSLQINDIADGIIHPITMYLSLLYFTSVFCTVMGFVNTLFMNILLPLISGISDPFGISDTSHGADLDRVGDANALSAAFMLNIVMSNVYGLLGLLLLSTLSDFKHFLPIAKGTFVAFYLTAVLATCSLFGGTVYSLKESILYMEYLMYVSPNFWYTQGCLLSWLVGREYKNVEGQACGQKQDYVCGDSVFEQLYGSTRTHQGLPLLALFIISIILVLLSFLAFIFNTRHKHSKSEALEAKAIEVADQEDLAEMEEEAADCEALLEGKGVADVRASIQKRWNPQRNEKKKISENTRHIHNRTEALEAKETEVAKKGDLRQIEVEVPCFQQLLEGEGAGEVRASAQKNELILN